MLDQVKLSLETEKEKLDANLGYTITKLALKLTGTNFLFPAGIARRVAMSSNTEQDKKVTLRAIFGFIVYLLFNPLILFVSAGTVRWGMAWVYFGVSITGSLLSRAIANRKNPGLLEERGRYQEAEGVKSWDKILVPIAALYAPMAVIIVAGLDLRLNWTDLVPLWLQILAFLVGMFGLVFASWAMIENRFFSAVVRIQEDRGHTVCNSGPYRYMRHPGYAGGILWYLITPLVLNAVWAYIPIGISITATVIRTALEDRTLHEELPGYQAYAKKTRYKLLPGIW